MMRSNNDEFDDETLVAYLDGELSLAASECIDRHMASDPGLRRRVDELKSSWALLDQLPQPQVGSHSQHAQSTIELVTLSVLEDRRRAARTIIKRYLWMIFPLAALLMFCLGAGLAWKRSHSRAQQLVDDLQVLSRYRQLMLIDSEEWLVKLSQIEGLLEAGLPLDLTNPYPRLPTGVSDLTDWLAELPSALRLEVHNNYRAFRSTSADQQSNLRRIGRKLSEKKEGNFSDVLTAYAGLAGQISSTELAQIAAITDLDVRALEIKRIVNRELAIHYTDRLSQREKEAIELWAIGLKEQHFEYFFSIEDSDSEIIRLLDAESTEFVIQVSDVEELMQCIEQDGITLLNQLDETMRPKILRLWVLASLVTSQPQYQLTAAEIQQRFRALPMEQQNEYIYLSGAEVVRKLKGNNTDGQSSIRKD